SLMSRFGEEVPRHVPTTSAVLENLLNQNERIYVLTKNQVQEEGYMANLEVNVIQPGPIRIQILRQVDDDTEKEYTSKSHITCTADSHRLFMDHGCCGSSSCVPSDSASSNLFIVVDVIMIQHLSEGYHSIDFTNVTQIKVLPGDMLGWYSSSHTGKVAVVEKASDDRGLVFEGITDGGMAGQTLDTGLNNFPFDGIFALSANVVPLSSFEASFNLEQIARQKVTVKLNDNFGNEEKSKAFISYQQVILGLTLNFPEFALLGNVPLGLSVTNGTNVSYIIDFGDDQVKEAFNQTSVTHLNFTSKGTHELTVMAFNDVSAAVSECTGPYILDAIEDLTILPVEPVSVNESFPITISLSQGSLVDLNVSLGDESPSFNVSILDVNDTFVVVKNHSYRTAGMYRVTAFATNNLTSASAELLITIQAPIAGLHVLAPKGVHSSGDDLVINVSVTQGTDVQYNVTFNGESKNASGGFATVVFSKDGLTPGLALLKVKAYNLVSHNESVTNISIETPIYDARLRPDPLVIEPGKGWIFVFYYGKGSNIKITFWKGTGEQGVDVPPAGEQVAHRRIGYIYTYPGVYTARANFSNALGSVIVEKIVIVQHPVRDIEVITDSPKPFPPGVVNVTVRQNGTIATNASVTCSYGDGTTSESVDFTGEFNASHRYSMAGDYNIVVNITNLASDVSTEANVTLIKTVTFLIIKATTSADIASLSPPRNTFPLEVPVLFEIERDGDVNISHYRYTFGDGSDFNATTGNHTVEHTYVSTGEFIVTITLKHQFGEISNSTTVNMKESIAGLTISDDAPTVVNSSTNFTFEWIKFGTGTLIAVDFGDGQNAIFGENSSNIDDSLMGIFRPMNASATNFTFQYAYKKEALYEVNIHAWNDVSSKKFPHRTVAVEEECDYPDPQILNVGANPETALNVTKDSEIVIYSKITIFCKASYATIFEWGVEGYHLLNESIPVKMETDLDKPSLTIPSHALPNGIISLQFTVKMEYIIDGIESQTVGYINVLSTNLSAKISGGDFRTVSSQRLIVIDGSISEDPDVGRGNLSGIQFHWFCRRVSESFPTEVEEYPPVRFKKISLHSAYGGCEGSGPRMLNYSAPEFEIGPGMLIEDETYVVKLVIRKDNREAMVEQTLQVFANVLPEVATKCEINCDYKVNTNSRLSMSSICVNCDQEGFTSVSYQWELHVQNENTGNWTLVDDLDSKAMVNTSEKNLVLRRNTLDVGKKYKLSCRVKNEESFEGRSEYHFITNVPPRNGNCTVSPTEGKVLETYFNIKCPGWHDEDGVFIYKVLHGENLIQHGQEATLVPSLLPQGLAQNNYTYNLTVQIFDKYNSFSEETLSVTVREATLSAEELHSLTHEDGLLTNMRISGNTQGIAQLVTAVSTVLDNQAAEENLNQNATTGGGGELSLEDSEAKKARMEMKEDLLGVLQQIEPESIDTAELMVEAMSSVTNNVEELSSNAQNSMLTVLSKAVTTLSAKKSADSLKALESVSNGVVANL
ncbi:polycystin-1-like, partial [Oculina patagonica]